MGAMARAIVNIIGAKEEMAGENTACPILTGLLPGKDMQACTSSAVSLRASPILSIPLCRRHLPLNANGGDKMPLPFQKEMIIFGTEAHSSLNSITAHSTAVIGRWTFTSEKLSSLDKCQIPMLSNSGLKPGIPNLTTGTSMREKNLNSQRMTKLRPKETPSTSAVTRRNASNFINLCFASKEEGDRSFG